MAGCQKEGPIGPPGEQGPAGPDATTQEYTLYFDGTTTWASHAGFMGIYDDGDAIINYIYWVDYSGDPYYIQLPYISGAGNEYYSEINNVNGHIFQNIEYSGGPPSAGNRAFKSVLIKSSAMATLPSDFDFSDYEKVADHFGLE